MKLDRFLATWQGTTLENRLSRVAILLLAGALLALGVALGQVERTVILVPPVLEGQVSIARDRASREVREAWALYVAELLGNVGPTTAEFLVRTLDPLLDGRLRRATLAVLAEQVEAIRREGVSMRFEPREVSYDPATGTCFVTGTHTTEGPAGAPVKAERTYELRIELRNYRPLVTRLDVYRGEPRGARQETPHDPA